MAGGVLLTQKLFVVNLAAEVWPGRAGWMLPAHQVLRPVEWSWLSPAIRPSGHSKMHSLAEYQAICRGNGN